MSLTSHELLQRFNRMRDEIDPVLQRRWGDNHDDTGKRSIHLNEDVIARFGEYAIGGIGFEANNDMLAFGNNPDGTPKALMADQGFGRDVAARVRIALPNTWNNLKQFEWISEQTRLRLIMDDQIYGGLVVQAKVLGQPVVVSLHSLRVSQRVTGLRETHGHWPASLLEIGGGHGRFIRDVAICSPETKFFYCDLPFNMTLAASYLSRKFPEQVNLVWSPEDRVDPSKMINIIAPWRLMELPEGVEVFCNFLSFQHMSLENLTYYAEILNARGVDAIYHQNRAAKLHPGEVDNSDYPMHRWYRTVTEEDLGNARMGSPNEPGGIVNISNVAKQYLRRIEI